jgi:hypothetical protein
VRNEKNFWSKISDKKSGEFLVKDDFAPGHLVIALSIVM